MKHITCIEDLRQLHMRRVPKAFFDQFQRRKRPTLDCQGSLSESQSGLHDVGDTTHLQAA